MHYMKILLNLNSSVHAILTENAEFSCCCSFSYQPHYLMSLVLRKNYKMIFHLLVARGRSLIPMALITDVLSRASASVHRVPFGIYMRCIGLWSKMLKGLTKCQVFYARGMRTCWFSRCYSSQPNTAKSSKSKSTPGGWMGRSDFLSSPRNTVKPGDQSLWVI